MFPQRKQDGFTLVETSIALVVIILIGVIGWRVYDAQMNKNAQNNSVTKEIQTVDMTPAALQGIVDLPSVQQLALADQPGVTVVHIELEQTEAGLVYKAELSDGSVKVYNARTGAFIKAMTQPLKTTELLPADFAGGVGFAKALEIAKAAKPDSKVYKIELELEGGVVVYSVRFTDKARVDVNAQTGEIVRTKAAETPEKTEENEVEKSRAESDSNNSNADDSDSHVDDVAEVDDHGLSDNDDDDEVDSYDDGDHEDSMDAGHSDLPDSDSSGRH